MAKKRANGEGNIRKRKDGRWEGRYTAGHDPETGKAIYKNVLGRTQAEAKAKLKAAIEETKVLDVTKVGKYTVGTWMDEWFENYAKVKVRPSSHQTYRGYIDNHIKPNIGKIQLEKLTSLELQKLYKKLLTSGRIDRIESKHQAKGLSPKTVRNIHQIITSAMKLAKEQKIIASDGCYNCSVSTLQRYITNNVQLCDLYISHRIACQVTVRIFDLDDPVDAVGRSVIGACFGNAALLHGDGILGLVALQRTGCALGRVDNRTGTVCACHGSHSYIIGQLIRLVISERRQPCDRKALAVCVVAIQAAVGIDDGVDRADELRALRDLVEILHNGDLVRDRAVDAAHLERLQAVDGVFQLILIHIQRQKVPAFQSHCRKCGVLNDHAGVLRDRLAEDADKVVKIILFFHARAPFCCVIRFRMT